MKPNLSPPASRTAGRDEEDAQRALAAIQPDKAVTVNIRVAADAMLADLKAGGLSAESAAHEDFLLGNIKPRQRMVAQFGLAGASRGLVMALIMPPRRSWASSRSSATAQPTSRRFRV